MKQFEYQKYDYSFLFGLLNEKQREEVQGILNQFVGMPNTEMTRTAVKMALDNWIKVNDIKYKIEISYE